MSSLQASYIDDLKKRQSALKQDGLALMMKDSLRELEAVGLPSKKLEHWKYTNILNDMPLAFKSPEVDHTHPLFKLPGAHQVKFVNGLLTHHDEIPGVKFHVVDPASDHEGIKEMKVARDGAGHLHWSALQQMVIMTIEKNTVLESPIVIHHLYTTKANESLASTRLILNAEELCDAAVVEVTMGVEVQRTGLFNATEINLRTGARLSHVHVVGDFHHGVCYSDFTANLARDSYLNTFSTTANVHLNRRDLVVNLNGENATAHAHGLFLLKKTEHCDTDSIINHNCAHTNSEQLFKGVAGGKSHGIFTGKIVVHRDAQKVDSSQLSKNLLLNELSHIDARPQLEVYADDVKCAHGATIGQLSEDELFYLESRGIEKTQARKMLSEAFVSEAVMKIGKPDLMKAMENWLSERYHINEEVSHD